MTILTGIKDGEYLAQFLGKKIAIRVGPKEPRPITFMFWIYPSLESIHANEMVVVKDSSGRLLSYKWSECENPYIILTDPQIRWEMK